MDDAFHLEAARWIMENPTQPMMAKINWGDFAALIYEENQPPLLFYCIALFMSFFGADEVFLHLLTAIFCFLALYYFHRIALMLHVAKPKMLLVLFAFNPALVVNQNLMTDVPILAIALSVIYFLLKGKATNQSRYYVLAAISLSIGLLIKYTLLPLVVVIFVAILLSGHYKRLFVLLIPALILLAWSLWNISAFGEAHLAGRGSAGVTWYKIKGFMGTLGSMATFVIVFFYANWPGKINQYIIYGFFSLFVLAVPFVYTGLLPEAKFSALLNYTFMAIGFTLSVLVLKQIAERVMKEKFYYFQSREFFIALSLLGMTAFILLFAPVHATRHILLLIPFLILLGHTYFAKATNAINRLIVVVTIVLGLLLGISDWVYADFYRNASEEIAIPQHHSQTIWSVGHWGWQWYSLEKGWQLYDTNNEASIKKGDFILIPKNISKQHINPALRLDTLNYYTEEPNLLTFFSGKHFASMYNTFADKPAWNLSMQPIDTVFVCRVREKLVK
ncbi:hypothetical protein GCM10011506_13160 [Marivirga lumbricoides]|uniref:Glycosyltransferase RgtA/B/C/D-like domain-containing protein n=2 Tax=Marivirga lumbricoides TaxID=1046115 RepID=A0ABQ1LV76_9BACT|nr:hypothetical protein GCM10011506_13160 [Marivirga lumbricoides]